jgi:hypothetical protein
MLPRELGFLFFPLLKIQYPLQGFFPAIPLHDRQQLHYRIDNNYIMLQIFLRKSVHIFSN